MNTNDIVYVARIGLITALQSIATIRGILAAANISPEQIDALIADAADEAQSELDGLAADLGRE